MKKRILSILSIMLVFVLVLTGCSKKTETATTSQNANSSQKIKVVTTTTMLKDLIEQIGGDKLEVEGLMGEGVDPHLYKATASDVEKLKKADVVIYQGLHLEGQMGDIFADLKDKKIIEAAKGVPADKVLKDEEGHSDPHIWFDTEIWSGVGKYISEELAKFYPELKGDFSANFSKYSEELTKLDKYIKEQTEMIPKSQRALVTAHDAFSYFSERYGFDVLSIQGVSTESEATTNDIDKLSDEIVKRNIKAIFVESSVPEKTIKSLQEAVKSKGKEITIGGELYSDSLGDKSSDTETYIKTAKANIDIIVKALK